MAKKMNAFDKIRKALSKFESVCYTELDETNFECSNEEALSHALYNLRELIYSFSDDVDNSLDEMEELCEEDED